jgi:hypothetical protein
LQGERILLGYIYGGIHSSAANIFWINTGRESKATEWIYPVYLVQDKNGSGAAKNEQSTNGLQWQVYPKPLEKKILVLFNSESTRDVEIVLKSTEDQVLKKYKLKKVQKGSNARTLKFKPLKRGTPLKLELIEKDGITAEQILIIN